MALGLGGGTKVGDAYWDIRGNLQTLEGDLGKSESLITKSFGSAGKAAGVAMTAMGGAITGALGMMTKSWANAGDEIQKMSQRTGFGTEALSELRYAADLSGTSIGEMEVGIRKMQQGITEAAEGTGPMNDALGVLGIKIGDIKGLSPEQQFLTLAGAIADVQDPTQKAALAVDMFGRSGTGILPMLADGAAGLDAMRQEARDLGLVFTEDAANSAAAFNDMLTKLKGSFQGLVIAIGPIVADLMTRFVPAVIEAVRGVGEWMREHEGLTAALVAATGAVGGFMVVVGPLLIALPSLVSGIGLVTGALGMAGLTGTIIAATGALAGGAGLAVAVLAAGAAFIKLGVSIKESYDALQEQYKAQAMVRQSIGPTIMQLQKEGVAIDYVRLNRMKDIDALNYLTDLLVVHAKTVTKVTQSNVYNRDLEIAKTQQWANAVGGAVNYVQRSLNMMAYSLGPAAPGSFYAGGGGPMMNLWSDPQYIANQALNAGRVSGLAAGGLIGRGGVVDVHRNERIMLPAGAEVLPAQHTPAGMAEMGTVGGVTVYGPIIGEANIASDLDIHNVAVKLFEALKSRVASKGGSLVRAYT